MTSLARLTGIARRFGSVRALDGADLDLRPGEIHGVLGENGAGKSTLFNVLGGMIAPDAGTLEIDGVAVRLGSPRDAWSHGIGLVHQHFTLVPRMSVVENLALGTRGPSRGWTLPLADIRRDAGVLAEQTGLSVPLDSPIESLGVGDRQRVEILKVLLRRPRLLVLDEPTAVLAPAEVESLFELLRGLAREGRGVALVTHKLDEVLAVADHVSVLRRGKTVLSAPAARVDAPKLIRAMIGEGGAGGAGESAVDAATLAAVGDVSSTEGRGARNAGEAVSRLAGVRLSLGGVGRGGEPGPSIDLVVGRGEIVGIAGVEGNGQRELAATLAGRSSPSVGTVTVPSGTGFVPQDRTREGVVAAFDIVDNVALAMHREPTARRGPLLDWRACRVRAEDIVRRYGVRTEGVDVPVHELSGGNQQRVVVGRELAMATDLLVAENPTRGLDVSATAFVHSELNRLADDPSGPGIVLISMDLDEVLRLSDRVLVMLRGGLIPVLPETMTREGVGALMLGGAEDGGER